MNSEVSFLYKHQPEQITEAKGATILRDFAIQTDRKIQTNRPDIAVKDYKRKTCFLIDMSLPIDISQRPGNRN